jgi:hypothetical protein
MGSLNIFFNHTSLVMMATPPNHSPEIDPAKL